MHSNIHNSTIYNSQDKEENHFPINQLRDQKNEILLSHKTEWNSAIFSNIDGPREYDA